MGRMDIVPASTKIRASRVRFIDTDRLRRRHAWLMANKARLARESDGRKRMRDVARELLSIEAELDRRA